MMRRILMLLTVVAMMVATMVVMAGTASAKANFANACEIGTLLVLPNEPGAGPVKDGFVCTGRPFVAS